MYKVLRNSTYVTTTMIGFYKFNININWLNRIIETLATLQVITIIRWHICDFLGFNISSLVHCALFWNFVNIAVHFVKKLLLPSSTFSNFIYQVSPLKITFSVVLCNVEYNITLSSISFLYQTSAFSSSYKKSNLICSCMSRICFCTFPWKPVVASKLELHFEQHSLLLSPSSFSSKPAIVVILFAIFMRTLGIRNKGCHPWIICVCFCMIFTERSVYRETACK